MLPHAKPGGMAGLLEFLNDRGGKEDLYHLAEELLMEVDDLLPIVEEAVLLGFAKSQRETWKSRRRERPSPRPTLPRARSLFRDAALAHVALLQQIRSALESKSDGSHAAGILPGHPR